MAIEYPDRVRSLTSMMSATGDPAVGPPDLTAPGALAGPPRTGQQVMDARIHFPPGLRDKLTSRIAELVNRTERAYPQRTGT